MQTEQGAITERLERIAKKINIWAEVLDIKKSSVRPVYHVQRTDDKYPFEIKSIPKAMQNRLKELMKNAKIKCQAKDDSLLLAKETDLIRLQVLETVIEKICGNDMQAQVQYFLDTLYKGNADPMGAKMDWIKGLAKEYAEVVEAPPSRAPREEVRRLEAQAARGLKKTMKDYFVKPDNTGKGLG